MQMKFLMKHNPKEQAIVCKDVVDCVVGKHLSLTELGQRYGANLPEAWLIPQLLDLSEYCGCREKISVEQMESLASVINMHFAYLKTTELMLFFSWMKTGRYGNFYGVVDPMVIMQALREFCRERITIIDRQEQEERERKRKEEDELHPPMSMEEYLKLPGNENSLGFLRGLKPPTEKRGVHPAGNPND